jgi:HK97 family phage major capsid protein
MTDRHIHQFEIQIAPDAVSDDGSVAVRVMPYEAPSERFDFWSGETEMIQFDQGSLTMGDTVPLTIDHGAGVLDRIGVLGNHENRPDGMYATLQFASSQAAQDTRELLTMGAVTDVSAGVWLDDSMEFTDKDGTVHKFGEVDHVAVVPHGQFADAGAGSKVLAVHSKEIQMDQVAEAPAVEPEVTVDYATASEVETLRGMVAKLAVPGAVQARGHEYKSLGDLLVDVNAFARQSDPQATERVTSFIEDGKITPDGKLIRMDSFAFTNVGGSIGGGVAYDAYIPDLLTLLRNGQPTASLLTKRQLPAEGNKVFMPAVSQGNLVGYQDGQGVKLADQEQLQILTDTPKTTIGGGQGVTVQAQLWTNPNYMSSVAEDLVEAYGEFQNEKVVNGDRSVDTPGSDTGYEGIMEIVGTTDVAVTGAPLDAIPLLGTAWAAVWTGTKRAPSHAIMSAAMWGALLNEVDTDGRPIIQNIGVVNPVGTGDAGSVAGTLRGLTVVIDDAVGDTDIIVTNFRDTIGFEDSGSPAQLRLTYPDVLVTDISVFGFSAFFIRRPAAYAILSGITIP